MFRDVSTQITAERMEATQKEEKDCFWKWLEKVQFIACGYHDVWWVLGPVERYRSYVMLPVLVFHITHIRQHMGVEYIRRGKTRTNLSEKVTLINTTEIIKNNKHPTQLVKFITQPSFISSSLFTQFYVSIISLLEWKLIKALWD